MARGSGVVARRHDLRRRDLQGRLKLTFAKGAALPDPSGLFNSSLEGKTRRAIDMREGEAIDAAAALNTSR